MIEKRGKNTQIKPRRTPDLRARVPEIEPKPQTVPGIEPREEPQGQGLKKSDRDTTGNLSTTGSGRKNYATHPYF